MNERFQGHLRQLLLYDAVTGSFVWRANAGGKGRIKAGTEAGGKNYCGYRVIRIDGHNYMAHRLAWMYVTGDWPEADIDHIDGIRDNNAFANLRDVCRSTNLQNQRAPHSHNTSGFLGVSRDRRKWIARLRVNGKYLCVGRFDAPELAAAAYLSAKRKFHQGNML